MRWSLMVMCVTVALMFTSAVALAQQKSKMVHHVRPGDSLWSIARAWGVSFDELKRVNGLTNESVLRVGQRIIVPARSASTPSKSKRVTKGANRFPHGRVGRVRQNLLNEPTKPSKPAQPTKPSKPAKPTERLRAFALVRTAQGYLGTRYRRGGNSSRGFDCSGLVYFVLRRHGIVAGRTAAELFQCGKPVHRDRLRPGDLVFFRNTYKRGISHVGIYMGSGKFVHASSAGGSVIITSLSTPYYAHRYAGARRVME